MTWQVIGRVFGDFGELTVECELFADVTEPHCFDEKTTQGPKHYFLNGLGITEQEARRIIEAIQEPASPKL